MKIQPRTLPLPHSRKNLSKPPEDGLLSGRWAQRLAPAMTLAVALSACAPHDGAPVATPTPTPVEQPAPIRTAPEPEPEARVIERPVKLTQFPVHREGELTYNYTSAEVEAMTRTSVTADQLKPGEPRLTAQGVDAYQGTKTYPEGADTWHIYSSGFKECTDMDYFGNCQKVDDNFLFYKHVECTYRDEASGEKVRVLQRSPAHMRTKEMDKYVCGGHRLEHDPEWNTYTPKQTDFYGQTLYLNPAHIVEITPVQAR